MSPKEVILTQDGLNKLEKELAYLKSVRRREVANRIKNAISFGDLSDNSEYEDAKNEQAFLEGRIITPVSYTHLSLNCKHTRSLS